jgi:hypothetical protein
VIRVTPGRRRERSRVSVADARPTDVPGRKARAAVFSFGSVPAENWERAFGRWTPETFRAAKAELAQRRSAERGARVPGGGAPAVHGDNKGAGRRLYRGFDYGLGCRVEGRADRRRTMQALGLRELHG